MTRLTDEIPSDALQHLVDAGARRRYPAQSFLFHEGDDPTSVYLVETGLLRVDRTVQSGRRVLLSLAWPGDITGELSLIDDRPRSATASTVRESRVLVIPGTAFETLLREVPDLALALLGNVTRRLRALTDLHMETTTLTASARVASRLVQLMEGEGIEGPDPIELSLPITQEELAQWAGLSREGAVKGLGQLRELGVLETARKRMVVVDSAALRREAGRLSG